MIYIKSDEHIAKMKIAGHISKNILLEALNIAKPGVSLSQINGHIEKLMIQNQVEPWFKEIGNYKYASCLSVNDTLVHGVPNEYVLKPDDIISIDIGVKYKDAYVDNCWTNIVGNEVESQFPREYPKGHAYANFLETGVKSLYEAISQVKEGNRIGYISSSMQEVVESAGYAVVRDYTGHGVGYGPHEDPYIPCFGSKNSGNIIKQNMVFAIEVMYTSGDCALYTDKNDGWSTRTVDHSISAMFEHTVLALKDGYQILTD